MTQDFDLKKIEEHWVNKWRDDEVFKAKPDKRKKFYLTVAYPYPSGSMHVGHGRTYTVPDVIARFKRMQGYNVLFPMAWHVTGSPVLGIAERIKKKDAKALKLYGELYKVPQKILDTFTKPENIVKYFSEEYKKNMTLMGYSIDWDREFLTTTPQYSRFIEWQYHTLHKKDLIRKGEHPVRYCPRCDNPVGDHDLLEGENATINEFTIIKFMCDDIVLPAATLRPETIFGVTNMWLNSDIDYVKTKVEDETWLLSKEAAEKLKNAGKRVEVIGVIKGKEFIGKSCTSPFNDTVPILPAPFVDPDYATGVVMSVPAHAPYDYIALRDMESDIKPISIIKTSEGGNIPAKDIIEDLKIINQKDKKLEEATETLYRIEHAKGVMKETIKDYGGMLVREVKEELTQKLIKEGKGTIFYEFSQKPVVCRCGTKCFIKLLKDQWFLEYSNPDWKKKAHQSINEMNIIPEETKQNFSYFIDWLKDWACTRRVGLGTKLPWDEDWLIEPLSDSTIYMSYYTISPQLKDINPEKLKPGFFDYILLGKGNIQDVADTCKIDPEKLQKIQDEFRYWYPSEWRLSAKDLVGNHLTFHVFHHTAIFPEKYWPKGIVVFGMGLSEGEKMSSSKGNIILLSDVIERYGSDAVRLFLMGNAEPWQDFDWRETLIKNTSKKLKQFHNQINYAFNLENDISLRDIDRWMMSRIEESIKDTVEALDRFQTRKALQSAFFNLLNDLLWYKRRCKPNSKITKDLADKWVRLMAPFTPFICEQLWSQIPGKNSIVSLASYPLPDLEKINPVTIQKEQTLKGILRDIQNILDVTCVKPNKIHLYPAPEWKRKLFNLLKEGKTINDAMKDTQIRANGKIAANIIKKTIKEEIPEIVLTLDEEYTALSNAKEFLKKEFKSDIIIHKTPGYDPENKEKNAKPMKPGIYIED